MNTKTIRRWGMPLLAASVCVLAGCQSAEPAPSKDAATASTTAAAKPGAVAAATGDEPLDGCPGAAQDSCGGDHAAAADPAAKKHWGGAFVEAKSAALASTAASMEAGKAQTVRVHGTVESVCKAKGCWMILKDGDVQARVFTKQHRFFLPMSLVGKQATVEGELKAREISEKFAKHLEEDRGGDPAKVTGPTRELVMNASAVALVE